MPWWAALTALASIYALWGWATEKVIERHCCGSARGVTDSKQHFQSLSLWVVMTRDQHDHVKRKDINKWKKRLNRFNTNRRIALYRLLGQNQEEILDLVRISNLAGAEGFEPSARGFGDRCSTNWAIPLNKKMWWTIRDSNPGPTGYEPVALTNWANGPHRAKK